MDAQGRGNLVVNESVSSEFGGLADTYLSRVAPNERVTRLASLSDYEAEFNPDRVNAYGLMAGDAGAGRSPGLPIGHTWVGEAVASELEVGPEATTT